MTNQFGSANLAVSFPSPYTIVLADQGLQPLLGYSPEELRGHSLQILEGQKTDYKLLCLAIEQAAHNRPSTVSIVLYDRFGQPRCIACSCSPLCGPTGVPDACLLALDESEVASLADAISEAPCAKALVSADPSHTIQLVNGR
eukprot:CAMPEP_0172163938 /NCGR_PEP_ID=MMETSP1050-20130122/7556_1 /TAXON_ID=233186 /ORGANISM="Cryptomonas curvata, Strain CCAP979/52" /LENGTH=142 /DNA_ID=CAMNT_0012834197 /DNA_START=281 /DNA_END=706 /DNA_ORIENTATION=+